MSESHVEQQVKARIQAAKRRTEDMRRQRAELDAARRAGKARAHAAKLRRQASVGTTDGTEGDSPSPSNEPTDLREVGHFDPPEIQGADGNAGMGQPPTTAGQSPTVAKGVRSAHTPGQADDRNSSPVTRGDTPTSETATTDEDQA